MKQVGGWVQVVCEGEGSVESTLNNLPVPTYSLTATQWLVFLNCPSYKSHNWSAAFSCSSPVIWKAIHVPVRDTSTVSTFKCRLKSFYCHSLTSYSLNLFHLVRDRSSGSVVWVMLECADCVAIQIYVCIVLYRPLSCQTENWWSKYGSIPSRYKTRTSNFKEQRDRQTDRQTESTTKK